jgi:hypothetical protein
MDLLRVFLVLLHKLSIANFLVMQYSKQPLTSSSVSLSSENFPESGFQARVSYLLPSVIFGGLVVIVLAIGSKVRGFKPSRGRWNFKGNKNQ